MLECIGSVIAACPVLHLFGDVSYFMTKTLCLTELIKLVGCLGNRFHGAFMLHQQKRPNLERVLCLRAKLTSYLGQMLKNQVSFLNPPSALPQPSASLGWLPVNLAERLLGELDEFTASCTTVAVLRIDYYCADGACGGYWCHGGQCLATLGVPVLRLQVSLYGVVVFRLSLCELVCISMHLASVVLFLCLS